MPNGGSDNCGTCWFNRRNGGEIRFSSEPGFCEIRGLAIENPLWTYCNNHPKHRSERDPIPIGPVWVPDERVIHAYTRKVGAPSPDTEEVRLHLLDLLREIPEKPEQEYGTVYSDEVIVWQLGEFREKRAIPGLMRVAAFSAEVRGPRRADIIQFAKSALEKIQKEDTSAGRGIE